MLIKSFWRCLALILVFSFCGACSTIHQPAKNVWKTTKGLWREYLSPPASVDYDNKGSLSPAAKALSISMVGVDVQLQNLEKTMQNADKPPTQEWLSGFLEKYPWIDGFAGVKYNGVILGQHPEQSLKELDFNPLLYADKKQNSRALRCDVQPSKLGPEIMLATPLYDGVDFLGVVTAYFEMRSLMKYSSDPENIVVLCPTALLWPGRFDFAATPLPGVDWAKVVRESGSGTCANANGSFIYVVRYLGNLPLVFATPEKGNFPDGNGDLEQGYAFYPTEREKVAPPELPERKAKSEPAMAFGKPAEDEGMVETGESAAAANAGASEDTAQKETASQPVRSAQKTSPNELQQGSRESVLLRKGQPRGQGHVRERDLEGENVSVERVEQVRAPRKTQKEEQPVDLIPDMPGPNLSGGRPSPFGPQDESPQRISRPSPFGPDERSSAPPAEKVAPKPEPHGAAPAGDADNKAEEAPAKPEDEKKPALLPGGRPSPFGPGN